MTWQLCYEANDIVVVILWGDINCTLFTHPQTISKTLSPQWREQFDLHLYEETAGVLEISVWDKDTGRRDDFIGRSVPSLCRGAIWFSCPDRRMQKLSGTSGDRNEQAGLCLNASTSHSSIEIWSSIASCVTCLPLAQHHSRLLNLSIKTGTCRI